VNGITLTVSSPVNNAAVTSASVTVRGKTVAGAEVFVNDVETRADSSGNFSVKFTLDEGENYILIVANDANGNYAEKDLTVTYTP
jgi:phosphate-selective porin